MGSLKHTLKRLEKLGDEVLVIIPQLDGSVAKFRPEEVEEAFKTSLERLKGNLDIPEHPVSTAAASSSDRRWRSCIIAGTHSVTEGEAPVEDLSE